MGLESFYCVYSLSEILQRCSASTLFTSFLCVWMQTTLSPFSPSKGQNPLHKWEAFHRWKITRKIAVWHIRYDLDRNAHQYKCNYFGDAHWTFQQDFGLKDLNTMDYKCNVYFGNQGYTSQKNESLYTPNKDLYRVTKLNTQWIGKGIKKCHLQNRPENTIFKLISPLQTTIRRLTVQPYTYSTLIQEYIQNDTFADIRSISRPTLILVAIFTSRSVNCIKCS